MDADQVTLAHRGLCSRHPENTLPSLAAAVPFADYCEIDVRVTRDGRLIIMHDATLRRTTDVASVFPDRADDPVSTFSLAEIERLDAGSWYDPATATGVPTLRQALALLIGAGRGALLELKTDSMELVAAELTEFLARHPRAPVAAASIDPNRSAELRRRMPELIIGVLFLDAETITDAEITGYAEYADFLCFRSDRITAALVDRVHRFGLMIMHNTNTRAFMDEGARHGADGTMTDYADRRAECARGVDELMIEAEALLGVCRTSGPAPRIRGSQGLGFKFSAHAGLIADLAPGDWLELPFVADRDRDEVQAVVVRHPAGGVVDVSLDGDPVAPGFDLRGASPSPQTIRVRRELAAGSHRLRFTAPQDTGGPATLMVDGFALRSFGRTGRSTPDSSESASRLRSRHR
jgi:glycerophosphoryl diester phosphodiesterase